MKKYLYLYPLLLVMLGLTSCLDSDGDLDVTLYPYASLRSISINDIMAKSTVTASDGSDSTVFRVVSGRDYPFEIDQANNLVYNADSLPMGSDITQVSINLSCDGVAYIYVDSLDSYEMAASTDSLDFTEPIRLLITSTDGTYSREYKVSLNVHTVDPNQLYWNKMATMPLTSSTSLRMMVKENTLYLFGCDADGVLSLATADVAAPAIWATKSLVNAPAAVNMNSITLFAGSFYFVADGKLYGSSDGETWENIPCDKSLITLFAASDKSNTMWAATDDSIVCASDVAAGFTAVQPLALNFPLYDISAIINPLRTNSNIDRYILIGRATPDVQSQPQLWGKLSTEEKWVEYQLPLGNPAKLCPQLTSLTIVPYDDKLYAIGGNGTSNGEAVDALSVIYVSRDNGLTWDASRKESLALPAEVAGIDAPFAAYADANGNIWLVTGGANGIVWRGRMNKLDI